MVMMPPNSPSAPNAAMTVQFHIEHSKRGVGEPDC